MTNHKKGSESGPVILRPVGFECMKAITVFVGKECKYKTITPELMLFTVQVIVNMCEVK